MIYGQRSTRPFHWLKVAIERGQIAGRISIGNFQGSGFLLDGGALGDDYAGLPLFFTARHVIPGPYRTLPKDITVTFDALTDDPQRGIANVDRLLASSPQSELNYSVLLLDRWPGTISSVNLCPRMPEQGDLVFVLGFPGGRGLQISLDDNIVLPPQHLDGIDLPIKSEVLVYRAPTEGGSSGSPVFNENWELTAMHMGGKREREANFGVPIHALINDARRRLADIALDEDTVARVKAARTDRPVYSSVFISYSHGDSTFADRLFNSLRSAGIRVWYDKQNILPGRDIYDEITKGIREQDRIVICFSSAAIASGWVDAELDRALQRERELFRAAQIRSLPVSTKILIPLDLDGRLLKGEWESGKTADVMSRGIADFRGWETQTTFDAAFQRLLAALRAEPAEV